MLNGIKAKTLPLLVLTALFSACSPTDDAPSDSTRSKTNVTIGATASQETRSYLGDKDPVTLVTPFLWAADDKMGVFAQPQGEQTAIANAPYTLNTGADETTAFFSPADGQQWDYGTYDVYAYYPYTETATDPTQVPMSIPKIQFQKMPDNSEHIGKAGLFYAKTPNLTLTEEEHNVSVAFTPVFAVIELTVNGNQMPGANGADPMPLASDPIREAIFQNDDENTSLSVMSGTVNLTAATPSISVNTFVESGKTISTDANYVKVEIGNGGLKEGGHKIYIMINPHTVNKEADAKPYRFYLCNATGVGRLFTLDTANLPDAFEAGKMYRAKIDVAGDGGAEGVVVYEDLSASGTKTANSYIIPTHRANKDEGDPLYYCFRVNREGNSQHGVGSTVLGVLQGTLWTSNDTVNRRATVVWEEPSDLITNQHAVFEDGLESMQVDGIGDYVAISVKKGTVGNAVVALINNKTKNAQNVTTANERIQWSWHIWVTDVGEVNAGGHTFLDRNLGATATTGADAQGLYYQWQRKDPIRWPGAKTHNETLPTIGAHWQTLAATIKNPTKPETEWFYTDTWTAKNWSNFQEYAGYNVAKPETKSAFDPCPYGWRMPTVAEWSSITDSQVIGIVKDGQNGLTLGEMWLPYAGSINTSANTYFVRALYWLANCNKISNSNFRVGAYEYRPELSWQTSFYDCSTEDKSYKYPCNSGSVRCIKNDNEQ